ncbi:hypothetical protein [Plantactinospora sp. B24E8]|uniref:hypothetical protein n=1 Tax=Plantactinospora sp. B24E8 TaxID=3153567 RepID=UPI00325C3C53
MQSLSRARRHARRCAWMLAAIALLGGVFPDAASAHPFGDPQQIEVSGEGDHGVRIRWRVGGSDDLTLLGVSLGVLPEDRVLLDGAVTYQSSDARALAGAPEFAGYLAERITVSQSGRPCDGAVDVADDLTSGGAELRFSCAAPVGTVTVTSRMLTDLHQAYRTLARGPDGQKAVYDATHESADWHLGAGSGPASPRSTTATPTEQSARQLLAVGGVMLAAVAAGILWYRRRRREA